MSPREFSIAAFSIQLSVLYISEATAWWPPNELQIRLHHQLHRSHVAAERFFDHRAEESHYGRHTDTLTAKLGGYLRLHQDEDVPVNLAFAD